MRGPAREERDARVLQLFVGGATYRQILAVLRTDEEQGEKPVGWSLRSVGAVHKIVQNQLAASAQRRQLLSDEALSLHQERTERLFSAHWATALDPRKDGSHRSAEVCRRILAQQARMYGLEGDGGLPAPTQIPNGPAPLPGEEDEQDELAKLRAARGAG